MQRDSHGRQYILAPAGASRYLRRATSGGADDWRVFRSADGSEYVASESGTPLVPAQWCIDLFAPGPPPPAASPGGTSDSDSRFSTPLARENARAASPAPEAPAPAAPAADSPAPAAGPLPPVAEAPEDLPAPAADGPEVPEGPRDDLSATAAQEPPADPAAGAAPELNATEAPESGPGAAVVAAPPEPEPKPKPAVRKIAKSSLHTLFKAPAPSPP